MKTTILMIVLLMFAATVYCQRSKEVEKLNRRVSSKGVEKVIEDIEKTTKINKNATGTKEHSIRVLGWSKDPRFVQPIEDKFLKDTSEPISIRRAAVSALIDIGTESTIEPLIYSLGKDQWDFMGYLNLRIKVIKSLRKFKDARAINTLINELELNDEKVSSAAVLALVEIEDERAVLAIIMALEDEESTSVRNLATKKLLNLKDPVAKDFYIQTLESISDKFRLEAAGILMEITDSSETEIRVIASEIIDNERSRLIESVYYLEGHTIPTLIYLSDTNRITIAVKKINYDRYYDRKISEIITEEITGDTIHITEYDLFSNPINPKLICFDQEMNIVRIDGEPVLLSIHSLKVPRGNSYNQFINEQLLSTTTKIYPCKECAMITGIMNCKYVW